MEDTNAFRENPDRKDARTAKHAQKGGAAALAALTVATAVFVGVEGYKFLNNQRLNERVAALEGVDTTERRVVIIGEGAKMRIEPHDPGQEVIANPVGTVADGHVVVITGGLIDQQHPGWIATEKPGESINATDSLAAQAAKTVWFNIDQLDQEGLVEYRPASDAISPGDSTKTGLPAPQSVDILRADLDTLQQVMPAQ